MSLRFRRSLRLMPGVRLNFSKSGTSVSFGGRGAHVTFGKNGYRSTIGLPGTGIYDTTYHKYGAKGANGTAAGQAGQPPQATGSQPACPGCGRHIYRTWNICPYCGMPLNEDGEQFLVSIIKHYGGKIDDDEFASPPPRDSDLKGNFKPLLSEEMSGTKPKASKRYEAKEVQHGTVDETAHTDATNGATHRDAANGAAHTDAANVEHQRVADEGHTIAVSADTDGESADGESAANETKTYVGHNDDGYTQATASNSTAKHPLMSREETFKALAREHLEESEEQLRGDAPPDPSTAKKGCGCIILVIIIIIIIFIVAGA